MNNVELEPRQYQSDQYVPAVPMPQGQQLQSSQLGNYHNIFAGAKNKRRIFYFPQIHLQPPSVLLTLFPVPPNPKRIEGDL